jgi:hypothetical protein
MSTAWIAVGVAIIAWALVGFFAWMVAEQSSTRASDQSSANAQAVQQAESAEIESLAGDTKDERMQLQSLANVDVVTIVDAIDQVGTDANVQISIGQAVPDQSSDSDTSSGGTPPLHAVSFVVQGEGTFANLFKAITLFQSLPVPSTLEEVDLERSAGGPSVPPWQLMAHIQAYTSANI